MRAAIVFIVLASAATASAQEDDPLACAPPIDDNQGTVAERAGLHYARGEELYGAGEYEHAIPEFRAAYCLTPAPEAIHAIAKSYESLVDYEHAVIWFEAYLHVLPHSDKDPAEQERLDSERTKASQHVKHLRALPAKLRVATDPPGAAIKLEGQNGTAGTITAVASRSAPILVAAGTYAMRIELAGYESIVETITAEIGQPYSYVYKLSPRTGTLRVAANPGDARILVDETLVGIGTYDARVRIGKHIIRVESESRPAERREVSVEPEETVTLHVQMQPRAARNGKLELMISTTSFGVIEGGILATGLGTSGALFAGITLAGGALGFAIPYYAYGKSVPVGQTSLVIGGQVWGAVEGLAIASTALGGDWSGNQGALSLSLVGGSVGFGLSAALIARKLHVSAGDAALFNSGGIWGGVGGFLVWTAFGGSDRLGGPMVLAGLNVGLLAGGLLGSQFEMSRGHVAIIDLAGFAGMVTGTALSSLVKQSDNTSTARFSLGGMALGLIIGSLLTSSFDSAPAITPAASVAEDSMGRKIGVFGFSGAF